MKSIEKSISELEGWNWVEPIPDEEDSYVVRRTYELHTKPVGKLSTDELRFLIGQNIGLQYLIPHAYSLLKEDIFLEAEYYPGDLYYSVITADNNEFWKNNQILRQELIRLFTDNKRRFNELDISWDTKKKIRQASLEFG